MAMTERPAALADHPLAPLTLEEVREAVGIVREKRDLGPRHRFAGLTLNEPPKEDVLAFEDGDAFELRPSRSSSTVTTGLPTRP